MEGGLSDCPTKCRYCRYHATQERGHGNHFCLSVYGVYIGAIWRIRLNRLYAAAMRIYVKLLWPLVHVMSEHHRKQNKCEWCFLYDAVIVSHPSSRHHLSYSDCLDDKTDSYQNCSVLCCVWQLCTAVHSHTLTHTYTYEQFLKMSVDSGLCLVFVHLFRFSIFGVFLF